MTFSRCEFRQIIRQKRNKLSANTQHQASLDLVSQFSSLPLLATNQHIALYLSADGEIDTTPLIEFLWSIGKQTYLPVLHPFSKGQLLFLHYTPQTLMTTNRFNIAEPKLNQTLICPVKQLDLICTPLVAFDRHGHRLGMGGGYYDRTLEPWFKNVDGPKSIGLAHDCQYVEKLPIEHWDVPLPKIVTPSKVWDWES